MGDRNATFYHTKALIRRRQNRLEKAFNKLRCEFIHDTLLDAGLHPQLVNAVMTCITTSTMQVLWNGQQSAPFSTQRGIHLGDPLSPYICSLCMERLSQTIQLTVQESRWKPIQMGRKGIPLSHLFFADDLIVFASASLRQSQVIQTLLADFCYSSGHKVSIPKTKTFFSKNDPTTLRREICRDSGIKETDALGKYLGVPLISGRPSSSTYQYILEKLRAKLSGWKSKSLSLAGRITLASFVLAAVPLYTMQSTLLPASSCNDIEKLIRKFIWGHSEEKKAVNLVKWNEVCQPLSHGGRASLIYKPKTQHSSLNLFTKSILSLMLYGSGSWWGNIGSHSPIYPRTKLPLHTFGRPSPTNALRPECI